MVRYLNHKPNPPHQNAEVTLNRQHRIRGFCVDVEELPVMGKHAIYLALLFQQHSLTSTRQTLSNHLKKHPTIITSLAHVIHFNFPPMSCGPMTALGISLSPVWNRQAELLNSTDTHVIKTASIVFTLIPSTTHKYLSILPEEPIFFLYSSLLGRALLILMVMHYW